MRLVFRFALGSLALATLLVGADALLTRWSLRRQATVAAQEHREARAAETLLRLENLGWRQVEQLRRLSVDPQFQAWIGRLAGPELAPEEARKLAQRHGFEQLLLLSKQGEILSSTLYPESYGLRHPAASFLMSCLESAPVLYDDWTAAGSLRCLGAVAPLRGVGKGGLLLVANRLDAAELARWAPSLQLSELHWTEAKALATPSGFQLQQNWELVLHAAPGPASLALARHGRQVLWFQSLLILLAPLLGLWLGRRMAAPLRRLLLAVEALRGGRGQMRAPKVGTPELDGLAAAFWRLVFELDAAQAQRLSAERRAAWREIAQRIAHEIKNTLSPLSLAIDNLETVMEREDDAAHAIQKRSLQTAREQLASLDRLVLEFRDFAQLPAPQFAALDPAALCRAARDAMADAGVADCVQILATPSLHAVFGDAEQLRRAICNLLRNAAEAAAGEPIELEYGEGPGASHWWCAVRDLGPGLPDPVRQRIGEPVQSVKPGGSGLGLAIVQQIARSHGGMLESRSRRPRGCEMRLELPKQPPQSSVQTSSGDMP